MRLFLKTVNEPHHTQVKTKNFCISKHEKNLKNTFI